LKSAGTRAATWATRSPRSGIFAFLLAIFRLLVLTGVGAKVSKQLKTDKAMDNNPLGRVLKIHEDNPSMDLETLELKMSEGVMRETPKLESGLTMLKIIAAVAPLMGLLGTVTGMIITFQAITIFGAGDPKAMAGGISGALITTVLGLLGGYPDGAPAHAREWSRAAHHPRAE
jgi:biopolymer transport protein ExbB